MKFLSRTSILLQLWICGIFLTAICFWLAQVSQKFQPQLPLLERPLLMVLMMLGIAFLFYTWSSWTVGFLSRRREQFGTRATLFTILLFGFVCRIVLIFSTPIQEIDLYRYIWDGAVVSQGIDPYRVAPKQVAAHRTPGAPWKDVETSLDMAYIIDNPDIAKLRVLLHSDPGLAECFHFIHFGQFSSPYPPVSQAVFRFNEFVTPDGASADTRMKTMKSVLVGFDFLTALGIIMMLSLIGWPKDWVVIYWWCPLVLKEFANSGHLDSIVIALTTWAIASGIAAVKAIQRSDNLTGEIGWLAASSGLLAAAVAAKVFPFVLFPIWFFGLCRVSWTKAIVASSVFFLLGAVLMWPILKNTELGRNVADKTFLTAPDPPILWTTDDSREIPVTTGIEAFSKYWEMNDLIFMTIVENVKPKPKQPEPPAPPKPIYDLWFVATSDQWRSDFVLDWVKKDRTPEEVPIWFTRRVTLAIFTLIAFGLALTHARSWQTVDRLQPPFEATRYPNPYATKHRPIYNRQGWREPRQPPPESKWDAALIQWGEFVFLTIAWFWLVNPAQNPWYWIWAMPFLIFVRGRAWFLLSGLVLLYYLRFYFEYFWRDQKVFDTQFIGVDFYYFNVPWVEFLPFFILLFCGWILRIVVPNAPAKFE